MTTKSDKSMDDISANDISNITVARLAHILLALIHPVKSEIILPDDWDSFDDDQNSEYIRSLFPELNIFKDEEDIHSVVFKLFYAVLYKYKHDYAPIFETIFERIEPNYIVPDEIVNWITTVLKIMSVDSRSNDLPPFPIAIWLNAGNFKPNVKTNNYKYKTYETYEQQSERKYSQPYNYNSTQSKVYDPKLNEYVNAQDSETYYKRQYSML